MSVGLKVTNIIRDHLGLGDNKPILESDEFVNDLGVDSLDTIELVMACEEEFDIEIADEFAEEVKTVSDAIQLVQSLV